MNEQIRPTAENLEEGSLFDNVYDLEPYEKSMRSARIWLYVIAGIQLIVGIIEYNSVNDPSLAAIVFGIDAGIALVFLALALWSRKKPVIAFTIALIFYLVVVIGVAILTGDFASLAKGIIFKVLVVVALSKANRDARRYESILSSLGQNP